MTSGHYVPQVGDLAEAIVCNQQTEGIVVDVDRQRRTATILPIWNAPDVAVPNWRVRPVAWSKLCFIPDPDEQERLLDEFRAMHMSNPNLD